MRGSAVLRKCLAWLVAAIVGIVVFPWGEALLAELGVYQHPLRQIAAAAEFLRQLTITPAFAWAAGVSLGLAAGILVGGRLLPDRGPEPKRKPVDPEKSESPPIPPAPKREPTPPAAPSPKPPPSTSWPRVAALRVEDPKFEFSMSSNRILESGECRIDIVESGRVALSDCSVHLVSVDDGETVTPIDRPFRARSLPDGKVVGLFDVPKSGRRRLIICRRDLKDIISRPPWLLRLVGEPFPLFDEREYELKIELRSNYDHPTHVLLKLSIGAERAVSAQLLSQTV